MFKHCLQDTSLNTDGTGRGGEKVVLVVGLIVLLGDTGYEALAQCSTL